jgi:protein CpxP
MRPRLITVLSAGAAMLAAVSIANAQAPANEGGQKHRHHRWHDAGALEHMSKTLDLTPDQQAKIAPILKQAKTQVETAREESRQKMKSIRDNSRSQIRPLLTQAQQQKWDTMQKAREDLRKARHAMRAAVAKEVAARE